MDRCPHCNEDMKLGTDFMYERDMFQDGGTGEFECPICFEKVYWNSWHSIAHDYFREPQEE